MCRSPDPEQSEVHTLESPTGIHERTQARLQSQFGRNSPTPIEFIGEEVGQEISGSLQELASELGPFNSIFQIP